MINKNDKVKLNYYDNDSRRYIELPKKIDVYTHIEVKDKVLSLLKETDKSIVLDMKRMPTIESSGVSVIVTVQKLLENDNRKLYLTNVNDSIREVMEYCKVPYKVVS
ncbi:MAG: STAS domain-containing protein [Spirochaetota bacterium]